MTALNTLHQGMAWLTEESRMLAGMVVAFGRRDQHQTAFAHYGPETLFDLASLTKMFTMLSVMKLKEQGKLRLSDTVGAYAPMFPHLKDLTLADIAAFTHRLVTPRPGGFCRQPGGRSFPALPGGSSAPYLGPGVFGYPRHGAEIRD